MKPLYSSKFQMPFGKHKGKTINTIPKGYLHWLQDNVQLTGWLQVAVDCALQGKPFPSQPMVIDDALIDSIIKG